MRHVFLSPSDEKGKAPLVVPTRTMTSRVAPSREREGATGALRARGGDQAAPTDTHAPALGASRISLDARGAEPRLHSEAAALDQHDALDALEAFGERRRLQSLRRAEEAGGRDGRLAESLAVSLERRAWIRLEVVADDAKPGGERRRDV